MTDAEKLALLEKIEESYWASLEYLARFQMNFDPARGGDPPFGNHIETIERCHVIHANLTQADKVSNDP